MKGFSIKDGMLIGTASAATQIEGGSLEHSWSDWFRKGHITDGSNPAKATDHYRLWKEDAELMGGLGMQVYRLGIEWARVEPDEGVFDEEAISRYVEEIELLKRHGISVLVTLHHFTNPMWFEEREGFEKKANIRYYISYVEKLVAAFGSLVNEYITLNEPNVYAVNGYYFGIWPPGKCSPLKTVKVMSNLAAAHIEAYRRIHELRKRMGLTDTMVSFANHMRVADRMAVSGQSYAGDDAWQYAASYNKCQPRAGAEIC